MNKETFHKKLLELDQPFWMILDRLDKSQQTRSVNIDRQIIWYCGRLLKVTSKIVPESIEMSSHIARCFTELEVILKWLKQEPENYDIFCADAEYAMLNLMKSKKEAAVLIDAKYEEFYEKSISDLKKSIENRGYSQYEGMFSPLHNIKNTAKKIDERFGKSVRANFDYFSKMSHPTSWLIMTDPFSEDVNLIRSHAMSEIIRALITILNTFEETTRVVKYKEDEV